MPDRTTEQERELKFATPLDAPLPDVRDLVGRTERLPQRRFSSVYFDTADMRLWQRGITLRYRLESGESEGVWTLKLPSSSRGPALERTEVSWRGSRAAIPAGVADVARGLIRRERLRETVELETTRQRLKVHGDADQALGEIDDDVVSIVDGPRQGERFRQVEFEMVGEEESVARMVADRFSAADLTPGAPPKFAVALGLAGDAERTQGSLDKRSSLRDVLRLAVFNGLEQLLDHDWRLRFTAPDVGPEDVHQARVAVRRLRSNLKTLQAVLDPVWTRHVRKDLKWIGAVLGDIRDVDVLRSNLESAPAELQAQLSLDRARAVEQLMPALANERYLNILDRLHAAIRNPPLLSVEGVEASPGARGQLTELLGAEWSALRRQVRRSGPDPTDRQLHRIRIGAKRLRYAAEMTEAVIGAPGRRIATAAEEVQATLGEHHDAVEAEHWLRAQVFARSRESFQGISVESAFAAGWLAAGEQEAQQRLRRSWPRSWKTLRRRAKVLPG